MESDPSELRGQYLFWLARECHIAPQQVDTMKFFDFMHLCLCIDALHQGG